MPSIILPRPDQLGLAGTTGFFDPEQVDDFVGIRTHQRRIGFQGPEKPGFGEADSAPDSESDRGAYPYLHPGISPAHSD